MAATTTRPPLLFSNNNNSTSHLVDSWLNNITTNKEELLKILNEKLRLDNLNNTSASSSEGSGSSSNNNNSADITETSISFLPDSIWTILLIILYAVVLVIIIVITIKACILFFDKSDASKFDATKADSPGILRMAVAGPSSSSISRSALQQQLQQQEQQQQRQQQMIAFGNANYSFDSQRSISPRSTVLLQQTTPGGPCYIYNTGNVMHPMNSRSSYGGGGGSNPSCWSSHCSNYIMTSLPPAGTTTNCICGGGAATNNIIKKRLLHSAGRGVSLESELLTSASSTGSGCTHYNCLHHANANTHQHHHSQQLTNVAAATGATPPPSILIPSPNPSPLAAGGGTGQVQRKYLYQHQHTNDSSLQWDSLNTNNTDHSGESPPSYEIALGVEIASRPSSANCSDREN